MRYVSATMALLAMAGCKAAKPYVQEDTGRRIGADDADFNAHTMWLSERVRGVDYAPHDGTMPTAAVARYRAGKIKKLPDSGFAAIRVSGSNDNGAATGTDVVTGGTAAAQ